MVLAAALLAPGVASAHNQSRVELLVTNLELTGAKQGVMVSADLIDRDSGASAAGFAITVSARRSDGATVGPVTMTDPRNTGHYEAPLAVGPGSWTVTAQAEQGMSALPALGSTRTVTVKVDEQGAVTQGSSHGGGSNLGLWVALGAGALVLIAGGFLAMTRKTPATQPLGQRVA